MPIVARIGTIIYAVCLYNVVYGTLEVRILWNYVQNAWTSWKSLMNIRHCCLRWIFWRQCERLPMKVSTDWNIIQLRYPAVVKLITSRLLSGQDSWGYHSERVSTRYYVNCCMGDMFTLYVGYYDISFIRWHHTASLHNIWKGMFGIHPLCCVVVPQSRAPWRLINNRRLSSRYERTFSWQMTILLRP